MLYRLAMIGIIAFWLVMMGLLVRLETHPETTGILDVPVSYVARIMFKHGQQSRLTVREEDKPVGSVSLRSSVTAPDGRALELSGALSVQLPPAARHRIAFSGAMNMDAALHVLGFHMDLSMQDPPMQGPHWHLNVTGDMARKILTYEVHLGDQRTTSQTLPMDGALFGPALLQNLGMDPNTLPILTGNFSPPTVTARETQITLRGEQLEVYEIAVHEGSAQVADFYVTQLGQIIQATTNFGYSLSAEDYE